MRPTQRSAVVAVAFALALTLAATAGAALAFRFDRAAARPGDVVAASEPSWPTRPRGIVVYLVPTRLPGITPGAGGAYLLSHLPRRGAVRLGVPRLTRAHRLSITFRVPRIRAGFYTTAFWCGSCAKRGDFFASALWGATPADAAPGTVLRVTG